MHDPQPEPDLPQPPPQIPQGPLWTSFIAPPLVTIISTLILMEATKKDYGMGGLLVLPLGLVVIIACLFPFLKVIRVRYQGRSVSLLGGGFLIGQIVICLALWWGTCLTVFA